MAYRLLYLNSSNLPPSRCVEYGNKRTFDATPELLICDPSKVFEKLLT